MLKTVFIISLSIMQAACHSFPYEGYIEEQSRLLKENYPESFKKVKVGNRDSSFIYQENKESPYLLVFVHGSPGKALVFSHLLKNENLMSQYSLLAVDRPGYGSYDEGGVERDLKKQAQTIHEMIKPFMKDKRVILVGHSFGGPVIARMAVDYPKAYEGLVFVAASLDPALEKMKWFQYPADWMMLRWMVPKDLVTCNQEIMALKEHLLVMEKDLSVITQKVSIVHGDLDELVPIGNAHYIKSKFSGAAKMHEIIIKNMNHFIPWGYPEAIISGVKAIQN